MEAELSQYHGIKWADVVAGLHAPRHILTLLRHMPAESRTFQILRAYRETLPKPKVSPKPNPLHKYVGWGPVETGFVRVVEQLRMSRHEYAQSVSSKRLPKFEPLDIPTPLDHDKDEKRRASLFELARQNHLRLKEGA